MTNDNKKNMQKIYLKLLTYTGLEASLGESLGSRRTS